MTQYHGQFSSCSKPLFQSEAKCKAIECRYESDFATRKALHLASLTNSKMVQYTPSRLSLHTKKSQRSFQSAFPRTTITTNTVKNNTYTSRWWINKVALFITINVCIWKLKYIFGYKQTASTTWPYIEYNICLFPWDNVILIRLNTSVFWMNVVFLIFIF